MNPRPSSDSRLAVSGGQGVVATAMDRLGARISTMGSTRAARTPLAPLAGRHVRGRAGSLISGSDGNVQRGPVVDIRALQALRRAERLQASVEDDHDALADIQR
jgi:hypothetical protein